MVERSSIIYGEEPAPRDIEKIEALKIQIVQKLTDAKVEFPIKTKDDMMNIFPKGTPMVCKYKDKDVSIHELIPLLEPSDFPIKNAGDAATLLTSRCVVKY